MNDDVSLIFPVSMAVVTGAFITYEACINWEFESAVSLELALFHRRISKC